MNKLSSFYHNEKRRTLLCYCIKKQQQKRENIPLNKGQHSQTRPGPRFEYCAYENSRKTSGIANTTINNTYGTRKAPVQYIINTCSYNNTSYYEDTQNLMMLYVLKWNG